jgi:glyoxylase-like metal-dependent hydrolase (beta-lactamase superfamily II)
LQAARAQVTPALGRIVQVLKGEITVHTYIAPAASFLVTSHIIETPNSLVIIDAQLLQTAASEVLAYAQSLGKPIDRLILSHEHPDHWAGANIFEGIPFVSTATTAANVQANIDGGGVAQLAGIIGENEVPATPRAPEGSLEAGTLTIDGVSMEIEVYDSAEAPQQITIRLPDQGVVVLQDLLFTNAHFFPGVDRVNWISILRSIQADGEFDTLLSGHGLPTSAGELAQAIRYLSFADQTAAEAENAQQVIDALTAEFPGYEVEGVLGFWNNFITGN